MKKTIFALLAAAVALTASAGPSKVLSRDDDSDWVALGTGAYQPGILDYYSDEYSELMPAAVYESSQTPGCYRFVPTPPASGALVVYDIIVHAENPDRVWCEDATFFRGIMNFNTNHKVKESGSSAANEANYGKMTDGKIAFTTPNSFQVMEMMGYRNSNINGNFALYMPGKSPADDPVVNDRWEVMGKGKYVEGLLDCEYKPGIIWDVEIEKSLDTPGCYRFKPYVEGNPSCPNLPEVADVYVYIHAEDPMEVYTTDFVLLNNQGLGYKVQHRAVSGSNPDPSYYGILEDGIITFPANSHYANVIGVAGMGRQLTNTSGKACIALPGSDYKDYYVEAKHPSCLTSTADGFCRCPLTINGGADVAAVVITVEAGIKTIDDIDIAAYVSSGNQFPNTFFGFQLNMNFPLVGEQFNTNRWTMIAIPLDAQGKPHGAELTTFFTPEKDAQWEDYATATYTDLFLAPAYLSDCERVADVTVQRKKGTKGKLRVVSPYTYLPTLIGSSSAYTGHTDHTDYVYINATDPDFVYIEEAPMGLNLGYGDLVASSVVGSMVNHGSSVADLKAQNAVAGKLVDDEVTFPEGALFFFETEYKNFLKQDCSAGTMLKITEYHSGIDNVSVDKAHSGDVYNLQGMRVLRGASDADVHQLPAGVYVVDGKKTIVR